MSNPGPIPPMPDFLKGLFGRTPEQLSCNHVLSSRMSDGKYFCPSCRLVSAISLQPQRPDGGAR
jgi:hypothetical protein